MARVDFDGGSHHVMTVVTVVVIPVCKYVDMHGLWCRL